MSLGRHKIDLLVLLRIQDHADDNLAVARLPDCIYREAHERIAFREMLALLDEAGKALSLHLAGIDADLADYKTFRIVTPDADNKLPPGMEMVTYYNIAQGIRNEMLMRGFTEDPNSPLLINIGITVQREIETEPAFPAGYDGPWPYYGPYYGGYSPWFMYPRGYYWPGYYNADAQVITGIYREGVLTMDFVDDQTYITE